MHWKLCEKWGFERGEKWYDHKPEKVLENEKCKILWDFSIQTDKKLDHNKPDILVEDKEKKEVLIIDPTCPFDTRIETKETQKLTNYNMLKLELERVWKVKKATIIPIVIGSLGSVTAKIESWIKKVGIECPVELLQKASLLGTARIIRKVTNI